MVKYPPAMQETLVQFLSERSAREGIGYPLQYSWASLVAQLVKNLPAMWETWVWSLGWVDPLEKGKATHSKSGLENSMDCIVHGVTKSQTWRSDFPFQTNKSEIQNTKKQNNPQTKTYFKGYDKRDRWLKKIKLQWSKKKFFKRKNESEMILISICYILSIYFRSFSFVKKLIR